MKSSDKTANITPSETEEECKIHSIKAQIDLIDQQLYSSYVEIGKKYIEYAVKNGDIPEINAYETIEFIKAEAAQKEKLQNQILELLFS